MGAVTYLFRPQYKRLRVQMLLLTTARSWIDEIDVKNILKRYIDKKTETVIKSQTERQREFLFSAATYSHLAHSWPGLNYMCKARYKTLYVL